MEFAARLPIGFKLMGGTSKRVLKHACADLLPPDIAARGKMGFGVPIGSWFRGILRDFLHETLLEGPARTRGIFDLSAVGALVDDHVSRGRDHTHPLWNLLMLELWHREFIDRAPVQAPSA
jgi:asparagine synthase (glutamine-hydrolysing)